LVGLSGYLFDVAFEVGIKVRVWAAALIELVSEGSGKLRQFGIEIGESLFGIFFVQGLSGVVGFEE